MYAKLQTSLFGRSCSLRPRWLGSIFWTPGWPRSRLPPALNQPLCLHWFRLPRPHDCLAVGLLGDVVFVEDTPVTRKGGVRGGTGDGRLACPFTQAAAYRERAASLLSIAADRARSYVYGDKKKDIVWRWWVERPKMAG